MGRPCGVPICGVLPPRPAKQMPSSLRLELSALPGLGSFMLLGLADYLQLALISVSFDSALSLFPRVLSLTHHAGCWAPFCPEAPPPVSAAKPEGYFGAATCCPGGPAHRGFSLGKPIASQLSWRLPDFFCSAKLWCWVCCPTSPVLALPQDWGTESNVTGSPQLLLAEQDPGGHCWAAWPFPSPLEPS